MKFISKPLIHYTLTQIASRCSDNGSAALRAAQPPVDQLPPRGSCELAMQRVAKP